MPQQSHSRTCTLCEAMCGIKITTDGDQVISIKGDKDDPFSRGYLCPKASALSELHHDPDRIRHPLVKKNGEFVQASWEEAISTASNLIHKTQNKYGNNALGAYLGNPNVHNFGALFYLPQFLRQLKTRNRFSATSLDQLPHMFSAYHMFGHQLLMSVPDLDHTDFMLVIGGNPLASNGSIMSAPDIRNRLKAISKRGGELVVLDPRRSETADIASQHHFIRPNTDAALLMAMVHVVYHQKSPQSKSLKLNHLKKRVKNLDVIGTVSKAWTPAKAARITGVPAKVIESLATRLFEEERALCYGRMGTSTQEYGGLNHWLINVLNILCGNMDVRGGMMFTQPALDLINAPDALAEPGHWNVWQSRVRGLPEFSGELPASVLAEEMLVEGEGQIKALITVAGNPVISAPNGPQLETALSQLEGYVAIDYFMNETTAKADVILPAVSPLERSHYDIIFHSLAIRNTSKFSPPVFKKSENSLEDWQIMQKLSHKLSELRGKNSIKDKLIRRAEQEISPERFLTAYLSTISPYRSIKGPFKNQRKGHHGETVSMKKLIDNPQGLDLGPLQPCLLKRLQTKDDLIDLAPSVLVADCARLDRLKAPSKKEFQLIGRRHLRSCNSWLHNAPKLKKGKELCTLLIHPEDAERLELCTHQTAKVSSKIGVVDIPIEISDEIMPGVVSIPHGYGHHRDKSRLHVAEIKPGVSINDLTDDLLIDPLTGNAAFSGNTVRVSKAL